MARLHATTFAAVILAASLASCGASRLAPGPMYPAETRQSGVLDIQVIRDGTVITMTNTTARAFGPSRVWLNRYYSLPVESFGVGQTLELELADFANEHGERYRAGGFFSAEPPKPIAMAQIETRADDGTGEMYGVQVVNGAGE